MTEQELMKPRFKVIADYPAMRFSVGDIINGERAYMCGEEGVWSYKGAMEDYPALFEPLDWYEHRKPEDMPQYVKCFMSGRVYKTTSWEFDGIGDILFFHYIGDELGIGHYPMKTHPSNEEEFLKQNKQ